MKESIFEFTPVAAFRITTKDGRELGTVAYQGDGWMSVRDASTALYGSLEGAGERLLLDLPAPKGE